SRTPSASAARKADDATSWFTSSTGRLLRGAPAVLRCRRRAARPGAPPAGASGRCRWSIKPIMAHSSLTLLGAGGHAWVVAEAARGAGLGVAAAYDDDPAAASPADDGALAGSLEAFLAGPAGPAAPWVLAIGDIARRRRLPDRLAASGAAPTAAVVHPRATVSPSATLGAGAFVSAGAVINARAQIGPHTIINTGAIIEHDCRIEAGAHIAPGAVLGGQVAVGEDTLVGLGARVRPGTVIAARAVVGAGAVVVADVPAGVTVTGVPARFAR